MFWHDVYPARKRVYFLVGNVHPESKIQKKLWLKIFGSIRNAYKKKISKKYEFGQNFGRYKERSYDADSFLFIFL